MVRIERISPPSISLARDHQFTGSAILSVPFWVLMTTSQKLTTLNTSGPAFNALRAFAESRSEPTKAQINVLVSSR